MNVRTLLKNSYKEFDNGDAAIDCDILICHILNIPRNKLFIHFTDEISENELKIFNSCVERLKNGEPVDYITGKRSFGELDFFVTPDVLIPRNDTEILLEEAFDYCRKKNADDLSILDLCTGSGCLAVSLAYMFRSARVYASDISENALCVARRNALFNLKDNLPDFVRGDLWEPFKSPGNDFRKRFDIIVSNPPYIPTDDIKMLDKKVKDYEPSLALDGGTDGLDFYRRITAEAPYFLKEKGCLMLEAGIGQSDDILKLMKDAGFSSCRTVKDYGGTERVVTGIFSS